MLTLKNDPTFSTAPRVVIKYKRHSDGLGQMLTLKNDPTCISALRVVMKFKLHWDGVWSNFNIEK